MGNGVTGFPCNTIFSASHVSIFACIIIQIATPVPVASDKRLAIACEHLDFPFVNSLNAFLVIPKLFAADTIDIPLSSNTVI